MRWHWLVCLEAFLVAAPAAREDAVAKAGDDATVVESELDDRVPGLTPFATGFGP